MSLDAFFDQVVPMLRGERTAAQVEAVLGPCPTGTDALGWYADLQAAHVRSQLAELFPSVHAVLSRRGDWAERVAAYLRAHPPSHWSTAWVGEAFADWLVDHDADGALLGSLADWHWTRFLARTAPDAFDGDGLDVRLFVRSWLVDAPALARAVVDGHASTPATPTTVLLWREEATGRVRHRTPSLATLAVLGLRSGVPLSGPLAALDPTLLAEEADRLARSGAILDPHLPSEPS